MNFSSQHKTKRLNLDVSSKYLSPEDSFFLLNHDVLTVLGKSIPFPSNMEACTMDVPGGENYAPNVYHSPLTNEAYSWHFNSNNVHFISVLDSNGICRIVYNGDCLKLSADPKAQITQFRAHMDVDELCSRIPSGKLKRLIWVDGTDTPVGAIDVESSIATNFFTTPFFDLCPDECAPLQLCVPEPDGCLQGEFVPFSIDDIGKSNKILDKGIKAMYQHVYYDNRASEWSDRSSLNFQDSKGCFDVTEGFSRCIKYRIPIGNPMVDRINFAFSEDSGITWFLAETIEKYKKYNSAQQYWYERELSETVAATFSEDDCSFDYLFCNDKQRVSIDPLQISRVLNPMPREVQALLPMPKRALGFVNYVKGNCPLDKFEVDKFSIALNCVETETQCKTEFATVKVRAIIHNYTHQRNQFVFREGTGANDDVSDTAKFGGLNAQFSGGYDDPITYDQFFDGDVRNFIVYVEGEEGYWAEMKQWHASKNWNEREPYGIVDNMGEASTRNRRRKDQRHGGFFYQEAILKVKKGTKGFIRMASHHAQGNEQDTSTFVVSLFNDLHQYVGDNTITAELVTNAEEIYFDTCSGDQDISEAFIIEDNAVDTGGVEVLVGLPIAAIIVDRAQGFFGYLKDNNGRPVEGAVIYATGKEVESTTITDHNGFFHKHVQPPFGDDDVDLNILVENDCGDFAIIKTVTWEAEAGSSTDMGVIRITEDDSATYTDEAYATVKVKVEDCNGVAVAGIRVALSGSKYSSTGSDGFAEFEIRNYYTRDRVVRAVVVDHAGCFTLDCANECNPCFDSPTSSTPVCYVANQPTVTLSTITINKNSAITNRMGLKNGGRYPIAIAAKGNCGRQSAAYEVGDGYIDIPSAQQSGVVQFCDLLYNGGGIVLPDWATRLVILRGANINPFELQWVVDKIEKTDDGKIKLTIQSLNDYNADHFFKTNTIYQYLAGDRVEFIRNGDGKVFDAATLGILNFLVLNPFHDEVVSGEVDAPADFFNQLLIEDDDKLDDLQEGAVIELQRPKQATTEPEYFEICTSVKVKQVDNGDGTTHGELEIESGTFSTFDTYLVSRTIGKFPSQLFEHHSPSDFWGDKITDTGRVHFKNTYENERRFERNISVNSPNQYNYFGDFEKTFDSSNHGGIVAVFLKDEKVGMVISENDNSLFRVSDDLLRLGSDNIVRAAPVDSLISNTEAKLRGEFGASYQDIGSIFSGDGYVLWVCEKKDSYVIHDYSYAKKTGESVSQDGQVISQCNSYFRKRIREKENFNRTSTDFLNHFRWSTGINKNNGAVYLTLKSLRHSGINNGKSVYELPNETIAYHPDTDTFLGFVSFCPEAYSQLNLNNKEGCSFLTYLNSVPFIHPVIADKYNKFYDVNCDWLVGISLNKFPEKQKILLSIEEQSSKMFFVHKVTTDKENFVSEIPPKRFKQNGDRWNAAFLNDINSRGGLYNGSNARGYWSNILLIRNNSINLAYNTIDNTLMEQYSELDQLIVKFLLEEQSGMTENI